MQDSATNGFLLPHNYNPDRLTRLLGGDQACLRDTTNRFTVTFYDSFDWRLHDAGVRLLRVVSGSSALLRLKPARGGEPLAAIATDQVPAWPADLPDAELKDRVAEHLEMRVLLPLVTVVGEAAELRYLNDEAKTVVRLQVLSMRCTAPTVDEPRTLWPRVRLLPVRGYQAELDALDRHLAEQLEWPRVSDCLFDEALTAIGREAGDYSSRLDVPLRPEQMTIDAMRTVLLHLLDTLERNIPGARAHLDSEFLHDLRVATRRTRSALSQVKRVFPQPVVDDFRQRFAWLGQITGPTRDLDVFLLELPRYRARLPASMANDLDQLGAHLRAARKVEQARLKRKLGSPEMRALLHDWRQVLEHPAPPQEAQWFADLPVGQVAAQRIWRMYKRVLKAGRAIGAEAPAEALHELRKDCKKLRYLIEFFRGLYPAKPIKKIIRTLKALLDNLGEFQDLEVQADKLRAFAEAMDPKDAGSAPTTLAIGALVADLLRRQQAAHERFAACFRHFDSPDNRDRYRRVFKPQEVDRS